MDQLGNGADPYPVFGGEGNQVGQTLYLSIVLEDFTNYRSGDQSREFRQITTGLGMPSTHQHAALLRHQRKYMSGLNDVFRLRILFDRGAHSTRTISC